jgi:hypothetical protein
MYISNLNNISGFFSMFFFTINHYIYCKNNNISFKLNTDNWLFKYQKGWEDYFKNIDLNFYNDDNVNYVDCQTILCNPSIREYKNIIKEVYIYNENTINKINEVKKNFNLIDFNYDSIFIRRGDKLIKESSYINASEYLKILLLKKSNIEKIFLQTDDYNAYLELKEYIYNNNLNIEVITLCKENLKGGLVVFDFHQNTIICNNIVNIENIKYINSNNNLKEATPVNKMNSLEIYEHTMDMIIGVEMVLKSNICITDYSSNVSRFIKLNHNNSNNVFNILDLENDIDYDKYLCPSYSF